MNLGLSLCICASAEEKVRALASGLDLKNSICMWRIIMAFISCSTSKRSAKEAKRLRRENHSARGREEA